MMGKVAAYYSDSPEDRYVYHDHDDCWEGKKDPSGAQARRDG
jgi:hypothetical protein